MYINKVKTFTFLFRYVTLSSKIFEAEIWTYPYSIYLLLISNINPTSNYFHSDIWFQKFLKFFLLKTLDMKLYYSPNANFFLKIHWLKPVKAY